MASRSELGSFEVFFGENGPRIRQALIAAFGGELGRESAADALAYAWEHWNRVGGMDNPAGYVFRVGKRIAVRSRSSGLRRGLRERRFVVGARLVDDLPLVEPALPLALARLSDSQRVCVVLLHGFGWTLTEIGRVLGVSVGTVQKHAQRGLAKLREGLGATVDA